MFSIHRKLFLTLKKVWIVKITPLRFPSPGKKPPSRIFDSPTHWWGESPLFLPLFGKLWSVTYLSWFVKIKSIQDIDWEGIWVASKINCLKPCVVVRESIRVPLRLVMSFDHHVDDLTLMSPEIPINWDFEKSMLLSVSSKPERKDSNLILLWLGHLYITATYPFLFCIVTSQTSIQVRVWCLLNIMSKSPYNKYNHHPF